MDNFEWLSSAPEWVVPVLVWISSALTSQLARALIPQKYWLAAGIIGKGLMFVADILGGNWGNAQNKPPEQIENEKKAKRADKEARKTVAKALKRANHKSPGR